MEDSTFHLPRILCLHGGGTNARIFRAQCRMLIAHLKNDFRLVIAQAPFLSQPGPDVVPVYSAWGPFRRWLRWSPEHPELRPQDHVQALDAALRDAMQNDDACGATGDWVALLGFSQGAKLCASLLFRQQVHQEMLGKLYDDFPRFRFGILFAGRGPLISLDPSVPLYPPLPKCSEITDVKSNNRRSSRYHGGHLLRIPTLHVHGMQDPGLDCHRQLMEECCLAGSSRLVEWEGGHRLPLKFGDVSPVVQQICELARETGGYEDIYIMHQS